MHLIKSNYNTSSHLIPSVLELTKLDLHVITVTESIDFAEAGDCGALRLIGVCFAKKETETLLTTRTAVIVKDRRGQGVGNKVNVFLEKSAKANGIKKISCHIYTDNLPSVILKLKRGYLVEGMLRKHDSDIVNEYIMSKFL